MAAEASARAKDIREGKTDPHQERVTGHRKTALAQMLPEFERSLLKIKNTPKHAALTLTRVRAVITEARFTTVGDIRRDQAEDALATLRVTHDLGHRTANHYAQAFEQFCRYLQRTGRLSREADTRLPRLNTATDVRHQRRALTPDELNAMIASAERSTDVIQCYDGPTRANIYRVAKFTGLRRAEIASLVPASFRLDDPQPVIHIRAIDSKNRKPATLPVHPHLLPTLRVLVSGLRPDDPLFPKLKNRRTWRMVKHDLEAVGIPYRTKDGVADFHAAGRHTFITELAKSKPLPVVKQLARHADIGMTMKYVHVGLAEQAEAITVIGGGQQIGSSQAVHVSPDGTAAGQSGPGGRGEQSPVNATGMTTSGHRSLPAATTDQQDADWRRRESNPRPEALICRLLRA